MKRPAVVLTRRGRAAAVLVDPALLDDIEESREVVLKVMRGLGDAEAGRTVSSTELFAGLQGIIDEAETQREG